MEWIFYILAGLGAGVFTGLAGLSAAVVITRFLSAFAVGIVTTRLGNAL